ncbi:hypothetical protein IJG90_04260 [Candidatus Saccharibacteria bacterium]|nr:hypothetical protein [Candidatus Saccharibacteria bacterium]
MQAKKIFRNIIIAILSITIYNIYAINNAYAEDTITLILPSSTLDLVLTPTSSGTFSSTSMNIQVTTSGTTGYKLSMTAASTNLTRTAAVNEVTPIIPTFTSLPGYIEGTTYSESNFPIGYWGYRLSGDTNYYPVLEDNVIADLDSSTADTTYSNLVYFASKLDNSKPAGSYTTTLNFTATTNGPSLISFDICDDSSCSSSTTYQAEPGMSWGEWIDSEYNTDNVASDDNLYGMIYTPKAGTSKNQLIDPDAPMGEGICPSYTIVALQVYHVGFAGPVPCHKP